MSDNIKVKVISREEQGQGVMVISVTSLDNKPLPSFEAGAHVDLYLDDGLVRQYSLCSSPENLSAYRLGILKNPESRGGSIRAHQIKPGDLVEISPPRNFFPLDSSANHSLLIGGGIGVTPMLAMADTLYRQGKSFEFVYCAKSRTTAGFVDEILAGGWSDKAILHFSDENFQQRILLSEILNGVPYNTHLYVCGPEAFMQWVLDNAKDAGFSGQQLHKEFFHKTIENSGNSFTVCVTNLNKEVIVRENQSITEALSDAGVKVKVSCQQGICGTCLANVLNGTPDHRDSYLTEDEKQDNDQIILCCSRSLSDRLEIEVFEIE